MMPRPKVHLAPRSTPASSSTAPAPDAEAKMAALLAKSKASSRHGRKSQRCICTNCGEWLAPDAEYCVQCASEAELVRGTEALRHLKIVQQMTYFEPYCQFLSNELEVDTVEHNPFVNAAKMCQMAIPDYSKLGQQQDVSLVPELMVVVRYLFPDDEFASLHIAKACQLAFVSTGVFLTWCGRQDPLPTLWWRGRKYIWDLDHLPSSRYVLCSRTAPDYSQPPGPPEHTQDGVRLLPRAQLDRREEQGSTAPSSSRAKRPADTADEEEGPPTKRKKS